MEKIPQQDIMLMIIGDFKSQVGKEKSLCPTIGRHALNNECNENGLRLVNLVSEKQSTY